MDECKIYEEISYLTESTQSAQLLPQLCGLSISLLQLGLQLCLIFTDLTLSLFQLFVFLPQILQLLLLMLQLLQHNKQYDNVDLTYYYRVVY